MTNTYLVSEKDLALFEEYEHFKMLKPSTRTILKCYLREAGRPLEQMNEQDILKFLHAHCRKAATWNSWLSTLRTFHAWITNKDKGIPVKKWKAPAYFELIEWKDVSKEWKYSPADMWTEEEVLMAISVLDHPRDKAMVAMLYDLAARPHELMKLRIKDIMLKENYATVKLKDHTGERVTLITFSFHYLLHWLNAHPMKDSPDAPLWVRVDKIPRKIDYPALYRICAEVLKARLGHKIHKPFNPYCLNHSRLTELAEKGFSDTELKRFRGWSLNSKMATRYIHMSGKGVSEKLLELAGIEKRKHEDHESVLKAKVCYRCRYKNVADAKYCVKCNFVLSAEAYEEITRKEKQIEVLLKVVPRLINLLPGDSKEIEAELEKAGLIDERP